jgi:hypothetical protein
MYPPVGTVYGAANSSGVGKVTALLRALLSKNVRSLSGLTLLPLSRSLDYEYLHPSNIGD